VILCVEYYDRWRERDVQAHALGQHLAEARLEALTAQLQPHFLFNTLQGISTLLYRDASRADDMLRRLSELLRRTLQSAARPEVTLDEELTTLEHYIAIQRIRFDGRLTVNVDPDGMGGALVPNFILQPLVENAIEHGIARSAGAGTIDVSASVRQGRLVLEVRDDGTPARTSGTGSPNSPQPASTNSAQPVSPNGIGLANTRARLHALFGDAATLEVIERDGGGFTVTIAVPLRRAETQRT
jgi:two-component system LytT family sensor kinase